MTLTLPLTLTREGDVACLRLNRAGQQQTMTRAMWRMIPGLLAQAEAIPAVKLLLVESNTPACFCAGSDVAELAALAGDPDLAVLVYEERQAALTALANLSKPSIALVRGLCAAEGLALALACDLRFADQAARIGMTQATIGLLPGYLEARALAMRVGFSRAADLMFSGRMLTASEAEQIGLVDDVWRDDAFDAAVVEYAAAICRMSQYAVRGAKAMLRDIAAGDADETAHARSMFEQAFIGEDFREACAARTVRRGAVFTWQ